jgi:hypothetical protein
LGTRDVNLNIAVSLTVMAEIKMLLNRTRSQWIRRVKREMNGGRVCPTISSVP